jgi:hypothetical protein
MEAAFDNLVSEFLGRPRTVDDGIESSVLGRAEVGLGREMPLQLRTMFLRIGAVPVLRAHNVLRDPSELEESEGFLLFMDESQDVVSWGLKLDPSDPHVWQRNNTDGVWYSEDLDLPRFLRSMFKWYRESGLFEEP